MNAKRLFLVFGGSIVFLYAVAGFYGWEFGDNKREVIPPSVRQSPGGYRSFHFWHSGYSGGK
ncbi:MAG: hypothetical protein IPK14_26380 [Blastocatellia bacterium]|nr:hypothetical protein [Blastocatellia bacterium]MBL8197160.1 hypothetical protein [Blastocatellia bacterium]MBN8723601.1 hypothetical protein [Acidobacteriota bacterium]